MTSAERMKEYERLFQESQSYNPAQFQSDFEKSYGEATNYNKDLIEQRSGAIGQAQAMPSQLREQYYSSAIRNPLAQEALIATQRGNVTSDISRLTDLLSQRGARYEDVLGKQLGAYQTSASQANTAAENAWRLYQDALAQEEAEKARAAAAAQQASLASLFNRPTQQAQPTGPRTFEIPEETTNYSDVIGNALSSGVTRYRDTEGENALQKYLELMRGTAVSSLGGIPGIAAYTTSVAPDVWGDIKSGATNLWNKLVRR